MTKKIFLSLLVLTLGLAAPAHAKSFWDWFFTPSMPDFERPLFLDGRTPHAYTWNEQNWSPESWMNARGSEQAVMDDLYRANIITDQYTDDDVQVLEVGQGFMQLAHRDKYKVATFADRAMNILARSPQGVFAIVQERTGRTIGYYTHQGLQLQ